MSNPIIIVLLIIAGGCIAPFIYNFYIDIKFWFLRKLALLVIGIKLLKSKDKFVRGIAWDTIRLAFWESK